MPRKVLLDGWHRAIDASEIHLPNLPVQTPEEASDNSATQAATEGVNHAAERESVFKREKAERFALEHHLGEQPFAELQNAMTAAGLIAAKDRYTTERAISRELETIARMKSGQGQVKAIASPVQVLQQTQAEKTLTIGQYKAILDTATSTDQFMAWQGVAGAGKTYSLKLLSQLAIEQGYAVTGYAPSAQAANVLETEASIESTTVARLLHSKAPNQSQITDSNSSKNKTIWIVDEAGLLSAKDAHALLTKAQQTNARVILVGDTRQLSAVEAGNPFKSLQSAGLKTAYLEESRRQKTDALKTAVVCLAAGEQTEGLEKLDNAGMVRELKTPELRHQALTLDYLSLTAEARKKTLILSGTNAERIALTAQLRTALQNEGSLGIDTFTLQSLRSRDLTAAQMKYACVYEVGDVVVPVRDYHRYGMKRREQYRVIARDLESNRLTLQGADCQPFIFDPATCADKTTYTVQRLAIAPGDQMRWTRNEAISGVRNGQVVTVEAIDAEGTATLITNKGDAPGEAIAVNLTGQQYLDYVLVSTTYSSQGKTADRVLADIDSTLSKEGLYVAVSRAKTNLSLYTADKPQLYHRAQRSSAKANPSDYLTLFQLVNPNAEDEKAARAARDVRSEARAEHVGDCAGERVEVSYRAAVRRDRATAAGSERAESRAGELAPEYVADVISVVTGIEERHQAEELERQSERIGEADEGIVSGAQQLEQTAAAVNRLNEQLEREARRLSRESQQAAEKEKKRSLRREIYQQYAAKFASKSAYECDRLVVQQLMRELLTKRDGKRLRDDEVVKVGSILLQGPVAQQLKRTQGKEAGTTYAMEVLAKAQKVVEKAQRRSHDRGMEL